jgi:hypothetical protein
MNQLPNPEVFSKRERKEVANRLQKQIEVNPETSLSISRTLQGRRYVELKAGSQVDVNYVDTGAVIATHESKIKDTELRISEIATEYIREGDHKSAEHVVSVALNETQDTAETANVFARAFREITDVFGRESIMQITSRPDISVSEGNAPEITEAIDTGRAFVISDGIKEDVIRIIRKHSRFGITDSQERAVTRLFTGKERISDNFIGIPLRVDTENPVFMYFMIGKTKREKTLERIDELDLSKESKPKIEDDQEVEDIKKEVKEETHAEDQDSSTVEVE